MTSNEPVLCVDLDGTLCRTDTLIESFIELLRTQPIAALLALTHLPKGRASFKQAIASHNLLNAATIPYFEPFVEYLRAQTAAGRKLLLVTGADASVANAVAAHFPFFSGVLSSNGSINLTSSNKLAAIRDHLQGAPFSYAGNSTVDLKVWEGAASAVVVNAPSSVHSQLKRMGTRVEATFDAPATGIKTVIKAMRVYQWSKNVLIALPLFTSHRMFDPAPVLLAVQGFFAFSFCASALYLINDIMDLASDRQHPRKRTRPFAAGTLSVPFGIGLAAVLFAASAALAVNTNALLLLIGYALTTLGYSFYFKRLLMLDVVILAGFYTLRLLYGGIVTGIRVSIWTLAFSMFLFFSLALGKRISELRMRNIAADAALPGRGYSGSDLDLLSAFGAASACLSVMVLILYINSPEVLPLYHRPFVLFGIPPLLIYWLSRFLILSNRGYLHDDPVVFALRDRASIGVLILSGIVVAVAI